MSQSAPNASWVLSRKIPTHPRAFGSVNGTAPPLVCSTTSRWCAHRTTAAGSAHSSNTCARSGFSLSLPYHCCPSPIRTPVSPTATSRSLPQPDAHHSSHPHGEAPRETAPQAPALTAQSISLSWTPRWRRTSSRALCLRSRRGWFCVPVPALRRRCAHGSTRSSCPVSHRTILTRRLLPRCPYYAHVTQDRTCSRSTRTTNPAATRGGAGTGAARANPHLLRPLAPDPVDRAVCLLRRSSCRC